ncbi:MAG TPA: vanadium-dependent haloperoxidase [Chitinophagaceae bacterium]
MYTSFKKSLSLIAFISFFFSCQKGIDKPSQPEEIATSASKKGEHGHLQQTNTFSSESAQKWLAMQLRILRQPPGSNPYGLFSIRNFTYCGIALYESVVPGMPSYQSLYGQLTGMPEMPATEPGRAYHWPTVANAALAYMNKHFYTGANAAAYQTSMDSLENALNTQYEPEINNLSTFNRSKDFGRAVAEKVYTWSTTDGALNTNPPFVPPAPPLWSNTAPNPAGIFGPYWGNNRLFVQGSTDGTASPAPPVYSEVPGSPYYIMAKEVYDISQTLTPPQIATAVYFRDSPGYPAGGAYMHTFLEIMQTENPKLDFYALANVRVGITMAESQINCWKLKYQLLQDRPIRYIRNVLGHTTWSPVFGTPAFPDYPSGHSQTAGAFSTAMTSLFGDNYSFTIHTYDYLGMSPRSYNSFNEMAEDIGKARVYAGIHYTYSCVEGQKQGEKIAQNILNTLKFKKD